MAVVDSWSLVLVVSVKVGPLGADMVTGVGAGDTVSVLVSTGPVPIGMEIVIAISLPAESVVEISSVPNVVVTVVSNPLSSVVKKTVVTTSTVSVVVMTTA